MSRPNRIRVLGPTHHHSPASIAGLAFWYRSDHGVTMGVGDGIASWAPMVGRGATLTQATAVLQPTLSIPVTPGGAAFPCIKYAGGQYLGGLNSVVSSLGKSCTIIAVARPVASGSYSNIVDCSNITSYGPMLWKNGANIAEFNANRPTGSTIVAPNWNTYPLVMTDRFNNSTGTGVTRDFSYELLINGVSKFRTATASGGDSTDTWSMYVAHRNGGVLPLIGELYEVIMFSRFIEDSEINAVWNYIHRRYRVSG